MKDGYLTFALCKGRLASKAMQLFGETGISLDVLDDSRKLIFADEERKLKFFLAKAPDVTTFVEYGAADLGVVGEDMILEEKRRVHEVLDLGFGKCRMCVCGPEEAKKRLDAGGFIRVASKYPEIAREYFREERRQDAEIIKLNGSVELGPMVGLSDVIVDIVETGSTLKENGLAVLAEICKISARVIVNPVSMQMEAGRIREILRRLEEATASPQHGS